MAYSSPNTDIAMGSKAVFELEQALRDWRRDLASAEFISGDNVDELEEHLRDIIADLAGKGLTQQEAFAVARSRLGDRTAISAEFSKVNGNQAWHGRTLWMLIGYVGGSGLAAAVTAIASLTGSAFSIMGFSGSWAGVAATAAAITFWTAALLSLYFFSCRTGDSIHPGRVSITWLGTLICTTLIVGRGVAMLSRMVQVRATNVSEFGSYAIWSGVGMTVVSFSVIVSCIGLISVMQNRGRQQSTRIE